MADSVKIRISGDSSEYKEELKGIGKTTDSMFKSMLSSQLLTRGIESAISGIRKLGEAAVNYGKQIVSTYADYEQLVGGVDTLFKESSAKVQQYAADAYKTTGLSANDYMESVTSFSASLISSLSGDTEKAAEKAQTAMVDMSDNANKMGTDMSAIQNAYQGFAKQNYTMLDNLKLGYGGTKEEMKRLLEDATKLSGIEYDISSYADVVDAIHVIQENMGIAGTTALEAEKTITGSINSLKAAFTNLLTGIGRDDADLDGLFDNVYTAIDNVANNITPVVQRIVNKVPEVLKTTLFPKIQQIAKDIFNNLSKKMPQMIRDFMGKIPAMMSNLSSAIPSIAQSLFSLAGDAVEELIANLPQLVPQLVQGIGTLFNSAVEGAAELVKSALFGVVRAFGGDLEQAIKDLDPMASIDEEMAATIQARIDGTATVSDELKDSITTCWTEINELLSGDTGVDETGEAALTNSASTGDASYVLEYVFDAWEVPEGAASDAVASIAAAMAQIDGAVNGLIALDATQKANLETMINNGATGDEIEAYLVDCGVDPTEAETIAGTISGASDTINTAVEGLGLNPTQKAILSGQKASTKGMIKQLMLAMGMPEDVLDKVLTSYDTFNSSVGGKVAGAVTSLTETIEATLTDGEADTDEDVEALKEQVRTVYGNAIDAVNTVVAEEIAKLDVNSATYDQDVQNIKDKGAEAIAELMTQENAYITFIEENAGLSTKIVTKNLTDLQAIEQQAIQTAANISALSAQYSSDQRDYMLVKSGADQSAEAIGGAMSYAKTKYDNSMVNAQTAYDSKIETLKSSWASGKIDDEGYQYWKAKYDEELAAQKEAAQVQLDETLSYIFQGLMPDEMQEANSAYDQIVQEIEAAKDEEGNIDASKINPENLATIRSALVQKGYEETELNMINEVLPEIYDNIADDAMSNDIDTTQLATAFSVAAENGVLDGSKLFSGDMAFDEIYSTCQTGISNAIGKVDVTDDMDNSGEQIVTGLETSLKSRNGRVYTAAVQMANVFVKAFNKGMEINSPSRRMMRSGVYTAEGFEIGVTKSMETAISHVNRLVGKFNISPELDFSGITGAMTGAVNSIAETESSRDVVLMVNGRELARTQASNNKTAMAAYERQLALGVGAI